MLDAMIGSEDTAAMSNVISPLIMYVGSFVVVSSAIQWIEHTATTDNN